MNCPLKNSVFQKHALFFSLNRMQTKNLSSIWADLLMMWHFWNCPCTRTTWYAPVSHFICEWFSYKWVNLRNWDGSRLISWAPPEKHANKIGIPREAGSFLELHQKNTQWVRYSPRHARFRDDVKRKRELGGEEEEGGQTDFRVLGGYEVRVLWVLVPVQSH